MSEKIKPTVVIDTNLFISGTILKGDTNPRILLTAWRNHQYHVIMSDELINEVENVLKRKKIYKKYSVSPEEVDAFMKELRFSTKFIIPQTIDSLPIRSRDIKDDKLLACALAGKCEYLITGDEDLLVLNEKPELGKLQIINAVDFLNRIE